MSNLMKTKVKKYFPQIPQCCKYCCGRSEYCFFLKPKKCGPKTKKSDIASIVSNSVGIDKAQSYQIRCPVPDR